MLTGVILFCSLAVARDACTIKTATDFLRVGYGRTCMEVFRTAQLQFADAINKGVFVVPADTYPVIQCEMEPKV